MTKGVFGPATDEVLLLEQHAQPAWGDAHPGLLCQIGAQAPEVQTSKGNPNVRGAVSTACARAAT